MELAQENDDLQRLSRPLDSAGNWGYQVDENLGLQPLGHQYSDPSTGRFLIRDPIKDGRNWYTYCWNNPLTAVDPLGLVTVTVGVGTSGVSPIGFGGDIGGNLLLGSKGYQLQSSLGAAMGIPGAGVGAGIGLDWSSGGIEPGKPSWATKVQLNLTVVSLAMSISDDQGITGVTIGAGASTPHLYVVREWSQATEVTPYPSIDPTPIVEPIVRPVKDLERGLERAIYQHYGLVGPR